MAELEVVEKPKPQEREEDGKASKRDQAKSFFRENPLALVQWTVVDQQGKITTVSLYDTQFGVALDPGMFQYGSLFAGSKR